MEDNTMSIVQEISEFLQKGRAKNVKALVEQALAEGAQRYYSDRFQCAYLRTENGLTVWYLDKGSAADRLQFMRLMGVERLCFSNAAGVSEEVLSAWEIR